MQQFCWRAMAQGPNIVDGGYDYDMNVKVSGSLSADKWTVIIVLMNLQADKRSWFNITFICSCTKLCAANK